MVWIAGINEMIVGNYLFSNASAEMRAASIAHGLTSDRHCQILWEPQPEDIEIAHAHVWPGVEQNIFPSPT